jgi:ribosomal protein RSM22 (predicted rRNA methylase)
VLAELARRGWSPRSRRLIDWGCGSGIAGRRALAMWPQFEQIALHDRSTLAVAFANARLQVMHPAVAVRRLDPAAAGGLLLVSHVANELPAEMLTALLAQAARCDDVIWVEAGTHEDSRQLSAIRERLMTSGLSVVAPCTHQARCGMLAPENERHWCHHFAAPPPEAFRDARWAEFGRELGIDLRSLPYSFLVLSRTPAPLVDGLSRVIGEPREAKGFLRVLSCQAGGVADFMLQKRDVPELYRAFRKGTTAAVQRWTLDAGKIKAAAPLG